MDNQNNKKSKSNKKKYVKTIQNRTQYTRKGIKKNTHTPKKETKH